MARNIDSDSDNRSGRRWNRAPDDSVHTAVVDYANKLRTNQAGRISKNRARERIYEGVELVNNKLAIAALEQSGVGIAKLNASKSIIDTFVARITKDRPMPTIVTDGSTWEVKQQGKKFRQFIVGQMLETKFDEHDRDAVLDASIYGNSFLRIDGDDDVFIERIPVNEIFFDPRDCRYGKPQQGFRIYRIARDTLAELYPKHKAIIGRADNSARRPDDDEEESIGDLADYVDVYEAWALPSTPDSKDGRHVICLTSGLLMSEKWLEERFPWGHLRLFKPRNGLLGRGFVDQLASLQYRVNCIVRDLQLNLAATGRGHFLVNEQNDIAPEMLTGWSPFKLKYKGNVPPQYVTPVPFNQAQLNALEYFINKMYDLSGVSKANAESKSALGAGASGIALDTQYDIDSDRFRMPQAGHADFRLACSQGYIDAAARVARRREARKGEKKSSLYIARTWKNRDEIERLDYDAVALKEGQYCLKIQAQNFLPDERAGKIAVVEQLAKAGVIEQWLIPTLFDEPDLVQANGLLLAPFKLAMKKMSILMDPAKPAPMPEEYNDLELELKITTAYYNQMQEEEAPLEIQDRYKQYADLVTHALSERKKKQAALEGSVMPNTAMPMPMPAPAGAMPSPGGAPMPQPPMMPPQ